MGITTLLISPLPTTFVSRSVHVEVKVGQCAVKRREAIGHSIGEAVGGLGFQADVMPVIFSLSNKFVMQLGDISKGLTKVMVHMYSSGVPTNMPFKLLADMVLKALIPTQSPGKIQRLLQIRGRRDIRTVRHISKRSPTPNYYHVTTGRTGLGLSPT
ncbi:serine hydrolase-like protein 2 [Babesia caballi]|uniref:Serine hydrolase-like protein 2 n=1 Tax=Babesia caballi TaxID=5871 RepID=A0AAV4LQU3_BABCB|nr:serine hydrolase-like protein 2 [Babesia caballi]